MKNLNNSKHQVSFNPKLEIHMMYAWSYAYKAARCGKWEQFARDHERFNLRIQRLSEIINPILFKKYQQIVNNMK